LGSTTAFASLPIPQKEKQILTWLVGDDVAAMLTAGNGSIADAGLVRARLPNMSVCVQ